MPTPPETESQDLIRVEIRDDVTVIVFNRPDRLNALTDSMLEQLADILREHGDGGHSRGIVITGAGRAFSAGKDLDQADEDGPFVDDSLEVFHDVTRAALSTRVPLVAAVNGIAVGGGAEIAIACDTRIGGPGAEYLFPENRLGLTISNGSSLLLPRVVKGSALRLILDGRRLSADDALEAGLLDELLPAEESLVGASVELITRWAATGTATGHHLALLRPDQAEVEEAMRRETDAARSAWEGGATRTGIEAYKEARRSAQDVGGKTA